MKFTFNLSLCLLLLTVIAFDGSSAGTRKYEFIPAKCAEQSTDYKIGGPLSICTFPPKYNAVPQQDIDAVIEHIKTLNLN